MVYTKEGIKKCIEKKNGRAKEKSVNKKIMGVNREERISNL